MLNAEPAQRNASLPGSISRCFSSVKEGLLAEIMKRKWSTSVPAEEDTTDSHHCWGIFDGNIVKVLFYCSFYSFGEGGGGGGCGWWEEVLSLFRSWIPDPLTQSSGSCSLCCWQVRSKSYLVDRKKEPAGPPVLEYLGFDWLVSPARLDNVCSHSCSKVQELCTEFEKQCGPRPYPLIFCIVLQVRGSYNEQAR